MLYIVKWFYAWLLPPGLFLLVALAMLFLSYKTKKKFWLIVPLLVVYLLSIRLVSDRLINQSGKGQQLGRVGKAEDIPNLSQNHPAVDVINAGNRHNHGIQGAHNGFHLGFHCIHLAIQ